LEKSESIFLKLTVSEANQAETRKHVLNGATLVPLDMSTLGKLGPAAEGYLQNQGTLACSASVVDRGLWLPISRQYLSCALSIVRGRGHGIVNVFRHYYRSLAKSAGKGFVMV
jgi:hypothetical protein